MGPFQDPQDLVLHIQGPVNPIPAPQALDRGPADPIPAPLDQGLRLEANLDLVLEVGDPQEIHIPQIAPGIQANLAATRADLDPDPILRAPVLLGQDHRRGNAVFLAVAIRQEILSPQIALGIQVNSLDVRGNQEDFVVLVLQEDQFPQEVDRVLEAILRDLALGRRAGKGVFVPRCPVPHLLVIRAATLAGLVEIEVGILIRDLLKGLFQRRNPQKDLRVPNRLKVAKLRVLILTGQDP